MNERIKELTGQTLDKHFSHTWTVMDYEDVNRFAEKFAELIVQECAEYATKIDTDVNTIYYNKDGKPKTIGDQIKEHFGVE